MEEERRKKKSYFRIIVDGLVIVMTILFLVPYLWSYVPYGYEDFEDTVTPDYEKQLNDEVTTIFNTMEPNFYDLYENMSPLNEYSFQHLATQTPLSNRESFDKNVNSVVYISTEEVDGEYFGSGSILTSNGVILTNYHVIEFADKAVVTTSSGKHYKVDRVIASDEDLDIVFLKIEDNNHPVIAVGNSDDLKIGDKTLAIGTPEGFFNSLSDGIVSGIRDYSSIDQGEQFQVTNSISAGNSGGPLLNEYGEIIGILTSSLEYDFNEIQVQNINFAVPINSALNILDI